jgi:hypothetical protein
MSANDARDEFEGADHNSGGILLFDEVCHTVTKL